MSSQTKPKIYVAGHRGMVGSAIVRQLQARGGCDIVTQSHADLDLTDQGAVRHIFDSERPDQVYLADVSRHMADTPRRL
jgi:GDP-L-fucose synthase